MSMTEAIRRVTWALRDLRNEVNALTGFDLEAERHALHQRIADVEWALKDVERALKETA